MIAEAPAVRGGNVSPIETLVRLLAGRVIVDGALVPSSK